jgi:serpin B
LSLDMTARAGENFQLNIANAMWGQKGYTFLTSYLDLLEENYGAGLRILDMKNEPVSSAQAINDWAKEETNGKIDNIISPRELPPLEFVLANAVYFKAKWAHEFSAESTHDGTFYKLDGSTVTVPMMSEEYASVRYDDGDNYQAAEINYNGDTAAMLVLLPKEGEFAEFEASLTAERLTQIVDGLQSEEVYLRLPKLDYRPEMLNLTSVLFQMGMADAFTTAAADFSGMDGRYSWLFLAFAKHFAFVKVDEKGTEAAAVTEVGGTTFGPPPKIAFQVNRPYIFLIRDRVTGTILFMGRILDPSKTTDG